MDSPEQPSNLPRSTPCTQAHSAAHGALRLLPLNSSRSACQPTIQIQPRNLFRTQGQEGRPKKDRFYGVQGSSVLKEGGGAVGGADAHRAAAKGAVKSHAVHVGLRVGGGLRVRKRDERKASRLLRVFVANHLHKRRTPSVSPRETVFNAALAYCTTSVKPECFQFACQGELMIHQRH